MQPTITVIRAIGVEFAHRAVRPLVIGGALLAVVLLAFGGWLVSQNAWWWIFEAIFILGSLLFVALVVAVRIILRKVAPPLSKTQKQAVAGFVDKLERVAENLQTPQIVIVYYVIRDAIRPRSDGFIETVSRDSKELAPDFSNLRNQF
jgi:MFS family permease